jgi:hypothetical protein
MLELEKDRLAKTKNLQNQGLIFPIVIRGEAHLPAEIKNNRAYHKFDHVLMESEFMEKDNQRIFKELADKILECYLVLCNGLLENEGCKDFRLPEFSSIEGWLKSVVPTQFKMPGY